MNYLQFFPSLLNENRKLAKQYVDQGKLSQADFELLEKFDQSPTKKYLGWMAKQWISRPESGISSPDELRNTIEEYDVFLKNGKAKTKDIFQFKTFTDLKKEIDELNKSGVESKSELRDDYEIIRDDDKLLIAVPHSHEASRYLGLSKFMYRDCEGGGKDSAWCTTFKAPDHFHNYYFQQGVTLYYVRVKDQGTLDDLEAAFPEKGGAMVVLALLVNRNGQLFDAYDGTDSRLNAKQIARFRKIVQI